MAAAASRVLGKLHTQLTALGVQPADVVLVHVYVRSMVGRTASSYLHSTHRRVQADFAVLNAAYVELFGASPPARVCVETPLPGPLLIDCCVSPGVARRMHVQGLSYWVRSPLACAKQAAIG